MRITEIIDATHMSMEFSTEEIARKQLSFASSTHIANITTTLELRKKDNAFILCKNNEVLGWLELGDEVELFGTIYDVIKAIYLLPHIRKTRAGGAFLVGLKKYLPRPLILGSDEYGGVLFKDGEKLVRALNNASRSDVTFLDLRDGKTVPIGEGPIKNTKYITIVFENNNFPLRHLQFLLFEGCETRPFSIEGDL